MKPIDVEYTFDHSEDHLYFTADGRVDFREPSRIWASVPHAHRAASDRRARRNEAAEESIVRACAVRHSWLADFEPVSIKMAKVQNLSLNPVKISGICGRPHVACSSKTMYIQS